MPTREQVRALSTFYKEYENSIVLAYLSDKLVNELENEKLGLKAMKIAEKKLKIRISSSRKDKKVNEQFLTGKPI